MKRENSVGFLIDKDKILLAHIEYPDGKKLWTGIGGYIEPGETPEQALIREFGEETFIEINDEDLNRIRVLEQEDRVYIYKITKWSGELKIKEPSLKELRWFSKDSLPYSEMYEGNDKWIPELFD